MTAILPRKWFVGKSMVLLSAVLQGNASSQYPSTRSLQGKRSEDRIVCKIEIVLSTSAHSFIAPWLWLLLSSPECSLLHGAKLMIAHGCSWVLNGDQEHSKLLLAAYECSWGLMGAHKCSWLLISSTHEKPWAWHHGAMSTHESSIADMCMVSWGYDR